jgi:tetratricopeptide (TPR) repeat protein
MAQADIETAMTRVGANGGKVDPNVEVRQFLEVAYAEVLREQPANPMAALAERCRAKAASAPGAQAGWTTLAATAAANRTPAASSVGMQSNKTFIKKKLQVQNVPDFLQKAASKHQSEGVEHFKAKNYEVALEKFEAALKQNPKLTQLLSYTSQCKQKLGKLDAAIADAEECVKSEPAFAGGYKQLAAAQRANGDMDAARATLTEGIKTVPASKAESLQKALSALLKQ